MSLRKPLRKTLEAFLGDKIFKFTFNPLSASHAHSVWERQIGSTCNVLKVSIAQCQGTQDDATFRKVFNETMAIITIAH